MEIIAADHYADMESPVPGKPSPPCSLSGSFVSRGSMWPTGMDAAKATNPRQGVEDVSPSGCMVAGAFDVFDPGTGITTDPLAGRYCDGTARWGKAWRYP